MKPPSGYRTYRLMGHRIHATPWAYDSVTEQDLWSMVALLEVCRVDDARLSADHQGGPYRAHVLDFIGTGPTPVDALTKACEEQQRMARARARALP